MGDSRDNNNDAHIYANTRVFGSQYPVGDLPREQPSRKTLGALLDGGGRGGDGRSRCGMSKF